MRKQIAIAAGLALALSLGACGGSSTEEASSDGEQVASDQVEEAQEDAQVFESDLATVTYRDAMEATPGNAMFNFELDNKTGSALMVSGDALVVNGEYSVQALGGAAIPIEPGTKGSVSLAFGYSVQTSLTSMDEIKTLSGELVLIDNGTYDELGRIPFSINV